MNTLFFYVLAAFAEIAGCFSFWAWLRQGRSGCWIISGMASLALFAWALTRVDVAHAGRAYAAYGGIYIVASLLWLRVAEGVKPDRWDVLGATTCLAGTAIILLGHRAG